MTPTGTKSNALFRDRNIVPRLRTAGRFATALARRPDQVRHVPSTVRLRRTPPLDVRLPWLAFDVITWLEDTLEPTWSVFEYGGGGSTAFFADRVSQVVTVEHDAEWTAALQSSFASTPKVSVVPENATNEYESYVERIASYPVDSFDLVVVDGRERVRCVENSRSRVRPGGYLMLDDSQRERYQRAKTLMGDWEVIELSGVAPFKYEFGHTTVWRRPEATVPD